MTQQHHHQLSRGEENNEFFNFWGVLKNVLWPLLALENVLFLSLFSQLKDKKNAICDLEKQRPQAELASHEVDRADPQY